MMSPIIQVKQSQALLFVIFVSVILGVLFSIIVITLQGEMQISNYERFGVIAFYLAQAGIENGKAWVVANPGISSYNSGFISFPGGRYRFTIALGFSPDRRIINAVGEAIGSSGQVVSQRQLRVEVTGIGSGFPNVVRWEEI